MPGRSPSAAEILVLGMADRKPLQDQEINVLPSELDRCKIKIEGGVAELGRTRATYNRLVLRNQHSRVRIPPPPVAQYSTSPSRGD